MKDLKKIRIVMHSQYDFSVKMCRFEFGDFCIMSNMYGAYRLEGNADSFIRWSRDCDNPWARDMDRLVHHVYKEVFDVEP